MKAKNEMIQLRDAKSGLWWTGNDFKGKTQAEGMAYKPEVVAQLTKEIAAQAIKAGREVVVEEHGYVSSANLAKDATKGIELTHARKLQKLADEIVAAMVATGDKWLKLCTYIRENQVTPKLVAHELGQKGFSKVQISKINKVANAPEEHWSKFAARTLGFKKVLELSRGNVQKEIAAQSGDNIVDVEAEVKRMEQSGDGSPGSSAGNAPVETDWEKKMDTGAAMVLRAAAAMKLPRQRTIDGKNGYVLVIKKAKAS